MNTEPTKDITPSEAVDAILAAQREDGNYDEDVIKTVIQQLNDVEFKNDRAMFLEEMRDIVDQNASPFLPDVVYPLTGIELRDVVTATAVSVLKLIDGDEADNPGYVLRVKGEGYNTPDITGELAALFESINS